MQIEKYFKESVNLFERKKEKERKAWDMKFQNYWSNLIQVEDDYQLNQTYSERLIGHVGNFMQKAKQIFMEIIDEIHLPFHQRRYEEKSEIPVSCSLLVKRDEI